MNRSYSLRRSFFSLTSLLCIIALLLTSCDSNQIIVNGLEEKEANEILVFLAGKGISAKKVKGVETGPGGGAILYDISVDNDRAIEAMAILNMNGLPRRRGQNLLGLFEKGGLVPSEMEERIRYEAGLAEQIASIIRKIDGVLDADIQLSFPQEDPLNPGKKIGNVTASVYVKHQGVLDDPNTHLITKIKRLVASSILGLEYDNVTVIADRARFSEVIIQQAGGGVGEEKEYVKVWSFVIAKDSLSRFRFLFFTMILLLSGITFALLWIVWKALPMLREGGFKQLLSPKPLSNDEKSKDKKNQDQKQQSPPSSKESKKEDASEKEDEGEEDKEVT